MKAADVMVQSVITVGPDATVGDVADLLLKHRISAMPVVDAGGKIVGIVSEGDLLRRAEAGTEHRRSHWLEWVTPGQTLVRQDALASSLRHHDAARDLGDAGYSDQ